MNRKSTDTARRRWTAAVAVLGIVAGVAAVQTQDSSAVEQFRQGVDVYIVLRQAVVTQIPPPAVSSDVAAIAAAVDRLAEAIRAARPTARAGDIFTPQSSSAIRRRIAAVLERSHGKLAGLLVEIDGEAPPVPARLFVNGRFDWQYGASMPADFIAVLPALPSPLQYRFVDRDLVLVDIEAGLVVDVLPRALTLKDADEPER
jgi:hypothetical protein